MAQVPTQPLATVAPADIGPVYQTDNAPANAFGVDNAQGTINAGRAIQGVGNDLFQQAMVQKSYDRQTALAQADVTYATKMRDILYGDGTAQNPGFYGLKGTAAVNARDGAIAQLQQAQQEVQSTITDPVVQKRFTLAATTRNNNALTAVSAYVNQQRVGAANDADQAVINNAINDAAAAWNNPSQIASSLATIKATTVANAQRNGDSADVAQAKLSTAVGQLFTHAIGAAAYVDPQSAQKMLIQYQDVIPGTAMQTIERDVKIGLQAQQAQQEHALMLANQQQEAAVRAATQKYLQQADATRDGGPPVNLQDMWHDPAFNGPKGPDYQAQLLVERYVTALDKPEPAAAISNQTTTQLYARLHLPAGDPNAITDLTPIWQARANGLLRNSDTDFLVKAFTDGQSADGEKRKTIVGNFIQDNVPIITGVPIGGLPKGDAGERLSAFRAAVNQSVDNDVKAGRDWLNRITPGKPGYVDPKLFLGSLQESLNALNRFVTNAAPSSQTAPVAPASEAVPPLSNAGVVSPILTSDQQAAEDTRISALASNYKTDQDVLGDFHAGKLSRADAVSILRSKFGYK